MLNPISKKQFDEFCSKLRNEGYETYSVIDPETLVRTLVLYRDGIDVRHIFIDKPKRSYEDMHDIFLELKARLDEKLNTERK